MIKLFYNVLFIFFIGTSALMASTYEKVTVLSEQSSKDKTYLTTDQEIEVITVSDLMNNNLEDFFKGKTPHIALKCEKGINLPFKFLIKGNIVSVNPKDSSTITAMETFYIRCMGEFFLFSTNLTEWKKFLEFFQLEMGVSLNLLEGTPGVGLNIDLNRQ